jgi:autophagy-related protein 27
MRLPDASADAAILSAILFPLLAAAVGNIDCTHVVVDDTPFDLEKLGGARSVVHSVPEGPSFTNTTYTIDICKPLGKAKDVNAEDQCPNGTRCRSPSLCCI